MRPIELDEFADHVREMHQDRDKGFEIEYQVSQHLPPSLPLVPCITVCSVAQSLSTDPIASNEVARNNKNKNRFANIFPCE